MSEVVESEQLKQIISKIEHIEEERQEISDQLKDTYNEAKALGFDVKIIKAKTWIFWFKNSIFSASKLSIANRY